MERPIIKDINEFERLCLPIVSYLQEHGDPHVEVHISMDFIKVTSDECGIPLKAGTDIPLQSTQNKEGE